MKLELERRTLRLAQPLATSYGEVVDRELAIVELSDEDATCSRCSITASGRS